MWVAFFCAKRIADFFVFSGAERIDSSTSHFTRKYLLLFACSFGPVLCYIYTGYWLWSGYIFWSLHLSWSRVTTSYRSQGKKTKENTRHTCGTDIKNWSTLWIIFAKEYYIASSLLLIYISWIFISPIWMKFAFDWSLTSHDALMEIWTNKEEDVKYGMHGRLLCGQFNRIHGLLLIDSTLSWEFLVQKWGLLQHHATNQTDLHKWAYWCTLKCNIVLRQMAYY